MKCVIIKDKKKILADIETEKSLNKKPLATRRKRQTLNDKTTLSESSEDEFGKSSNTRTRRSRSKSTEVGRKRGRPRKNQNTPADEKQMRYIRTNLSFQNLF